MVSVFLAHTAHLQFLGLVTGVLAWIFTMATVGLNEWRLWYVSDVSVVTSGVAWVGIWRACFYSHALPGVEFCRGIGMGQAFVPAEIVAAQAMMMLAVACGLAGNIAAACAVRSVYFSLEERGNVRLLFVLAGALHFVTGTLSAVPLVWNVNAVFSNSSIDFPPEFHLPAAPLRQQVGSAIGVGLFGSGLMFASGLLFLSYRYVRHSLRSEVTPGGVHRGRDNPAFLSENVS